MEETHKSCTCEWCGKEVKEGDDFIIHVKRDNKKRIISETKWHELCHEKLIDMIGGE